MNPYVHGYSCKENIRLQDQALTMSNLIHSDVSYPEGSRVLEIGCGIGAQTITLAKNNPGALITAIDISTTSLSQAKNRVHSAGYINVDFQQGDISKPDVLNLKPQSFDHIFVCFVLEHLEQPVVALQTMKSLLRPGGTITLFEGDNGSAFFYPESDAAYAAIDSLVKLQARSGGNGLIGRTVYQLLMAAGYTHIQASPATVYADASKPEWVEGFVKKTYTAMIADARDLILAEEIIDANTFDQGISDLLRTTEPGGCFCFTFFKAIAKV